MPWYSEVQELVGSIAIGEGLIRSVDDPIVNYLPELKGRGFDPITIRNLLMMQSGIRYRISQFPWDQDAIAYFYPNLSNCKESQATCSLGNLRRMARSWRLLLRL